MPALLALPPPAERTPLSEVGESKRPGDARFSEKIKSSRFIGSACDSVCSEVLRSCAMPLGALELARAEADDGAATMAVTAPAADNGANL